MSVKESQPDQHSPKRRKLSHGADERDNDKSNTSQKLEVPVNDAGVTGTSQKKQTARRDSTTKGTMATSSTVLPTGGLNKSSVLALQVADLNEELTPNYQRLRSKWHGVASMLETIIKQTPSRPPTAATDARKSFNKQGIKIPFPDPQPTKETNYKFEFQPPRQIVIGGALPLSLCLKHEYTIELTAIMPEDILQEKDYLNARAPHKAAFYLACIASYIKEKEGSNFEISFAYMDDVHFLPILELVPKHQALSKFRFRVGVGFPDASIPVAKTLPTKNCLRHAASGEKTSVDRPTPFYNSSIRSAASISTLEDLVQKARSPAFEDASRIGQQWLKLRGFSSSCRTGGFGWREWCYMSALLLRGGGHKGHPLFSKQYSSVQFFKAMLQILAGRDLRDPMVVNGSTKIEIERSDCPILFDARTGVNVLYKMSSWSYQSLRHHAQTSLAAVNSRSGDSFDSTFGVNVATPVLQYDRLFTIKMPAAMYKTAADEREGLLRMHRILERGLGDRATLVDFRIPSRPSWSLNQDPTLNIRGEYELEIGLLTNPDNVSRLVDHGPAAEEQDEAAEFRRFWGEKAELRRFRDGSISESLVWAPGTSVLLQIISHLAMLHFKIPPSSVEAKGQDLEVKILGDGSPVGAKDAFRIIGSTFQTLTSTLHGLDGLPLPIRSISPTDPGLRSASVGHPLLPQTTRPLNFIIQFESSTRWPDSLPAIQYTKIAFLLKVAELLMATNSSLETRVGLENTETCVTGHLNTSFLDIIYPSPGPGLGPICFRARIHHDREEHLLQAALADNTIHGSVRDALTAALATYRRDFLAQPGHTTAIRNLCTRFVPLSATMRLLKRWVSSHLLLQHIPEEVLEIIAAQIFLHSTPWSTPGSSTTAFLRCLRFLSQWDWSSTPLIVDLSLSQDMPASQLTDLQTRFQAWRKLDPSMNNVVWFVGTNLDGTGTVWTQGARPPRVVAGRVSALARAAVDVVVAKGTQMHDSDWTELFTSPLTDFDFQIHLRPSVLRSHKSKSARLSGGAAGEFKNLQVQEALDTSSIGHDPVELFVRDLNHAFGNAAVFFHDPHGGKVVAGLWKPNAMGTKEWRVRLPWSSVPVRGSKGDQEGDSEKEMCTLNKDGVLAEIAMLGDGMVKDITVKEG
ncbi:U3 small nucleolar RNA-associated protein 22 [Exophiala dermatitidis]